MKVSRNNGAAVTKDSLGLLWNLCNIKIFRIPTVIKRRIDRRLASKSHQILSWSRSLTVITRRKNEFLFQGFNLQDKEMDGDEEALERYEIDKRKREEDPKEIDLNKM